MVQFELRDDTILDEQRRQHSGQMAVAFEARARTVACRPHYQTLRLQGGPRGFEVRIDDGHSLVQGRQSGGLNGDLVQAKGAFPTALSEKSPVAPAARWKGCPPSVKAICAGP